MESQKRALERAWPSRESAVLWPEALGGGALYARHPGLAEPVTRSWL